MNYLINNLSVLSILLNTLTGGSYRNTFSARCGYMAHVHNKKWARVAVKVIDWMFTPFGLNHCYNEYLNEYK